MSRVKGSDTKIEKYFRFLLWQNNIRYRKNNKKYFGKPDITMTGKKTVIFIDSCFWHGCKKHLRIPKTNVDFWNNKIDNNIKRDNAVNDYYEDKKWTVIRIWEYDLTKSTITNKIIKRLKV